MVLRRKAWQSFTRLRMCDFVETTFSKKQPTLVADNVWLFQPVSRCSTIRSQVVSTIVRNLGQDNQDQIEPDQLTEESRQQLVPSINVPGIPGLRQNEINALRFGAAQTD